MRDINYSLTAQSIDLFRGDIPDSVYTELKDIPHIAWDIETTGLDFRTCQIGTCQLCTPDDKVNIVDVTNSKPANLIRLLESTTPKKIFHHAPFDLGFMYSKWGVEARNIYCTKLVSKLLNKGLASSKNSLKDLVYYYFDLTLDKAERTSNWCNSHLSVSQINYAANDVLYLIPLMLKQLEELEANNLLNFANRCLDHIPTRVILDVDGYNDIYTY